MINYAKQTSQQVSKQTKQTNYGYLTELTPRIHKILPLAFLLRMIGVSLLDLKHLIPVFLLRALD